jgi:hypothetical protein
MESAEQLSRIAPENMLRVAPKPLNPLQAERGSNRKKRKAIPEAERLNAEEQTGIPRPKLTGSDSSCRTLKDYWKIFKNKWEPLELKYGNKWRIDLPCTVADGTTVLSNSRSQWWSRRKGMYDTVNFLKRKFKDEDSGLTFEAAEKMAVDEAEKIFDTVPVAPDGRKKIDDINKVFRDALEALGQPSQRGRPRKSTSENNQTTGRRPQKKQRSNHAQDAFGSAFSHVPIEVETLKYIEHE